MVEEREKYPETTTVFSQDFCMDEMLSGCDDVTEARKHQADLITLLANAGFPLRKWCSNHPRILEAVPTAAWEIVLLKQMNGKDKVETLGLCWHPTLDKYTTSNSKMSVASTDVSNVQLLQL
jgi:hypothetical protein